MFRLARLVIALYVLASAPAFSQDDVLTLESLTRLAKAGMSDDIIVAAIQSAKTITIDTSTDGLLAMQRAGLSQPVIRTVIERKRSAPTGATQTQGLRQQVPPSASDISGQWGGTYTDAKTRQTLPLELMIGQSGQQIFGSLKMGLYRGDLSSGVITGSSFSFRSTILTNMAIAYFQFDGSTDGRSLHGNLSMLSEGLVNDRTSGTFDLRRTSSAAAPLSGVSPQASTPSSLSKEFQGAGFRLRVPRDWESKELNAGMTFRLAPPEGLQTNQQGRADMRIGMLAGYYRTSDQNLKNSLSTFVRQLLPTARPDSVDPTLISTSLSGKRGAPIAYKVPESDGGSSSVWIVGVQQPPGAFYLLFTAPTSKLRDYVPVWKAIAESVQLQNQTGIAVPVPPSTSAVPQASIRDPVIPPPSPTTPSVSSVSTDPTYWKEKLADLWLRLGRMPPPKSSWQELLSMNIFGKADEYFEIYLLAVDRNGLAANTGIAARTFLERGDYQLTAKFYRQALLFEADSGNLFTAAEDVNMRSLDKAYSAVKTVYDSSKYSSRILAAVTCPTTPAPEFCTNAVDTIFMTTDFAVDYSAYGVREATKNLIRDAIVSEVMKDSGTRGFLQKSVGQSGLYEELSKVSSNKDFRVAVMRAAAETGVMIPEETLKACLDALGEAVNRFRQ